MEVPFEMTVVSVSVPKVWGEIMPADKFDVTMNIPSLRKKRERLDWATRREPLMRRPRRSSTYGRYAAPIACNLLRTELGSIPSVPRFFHRCSSKEHNVHTLLFVLICRK